MEKDEVARFKYNLIWEAVDQRSRNIYSMGGFLIGTALLSMVYAAVNLRNMAFPTALVLASTSIVISFVWLFVFWRVNMFNDECFKHLRELEGMKEGMVGNAQNLMWNWSKKLPISGHAIRFAFYFLVVFFVFAWIALLCLNLFGLS